MRTVHVIIFLFGLLVFLFATENKSFAQSKRLNYGFKAGLNALSPTKYKTYYAGESTSGSYTSKNGYLLGAFLRINYDNFFVQPEAIWNYHSQRCGFMIFNSNSNKPDLSKSLDINMKASNINMLLGYSIINQKPYLCDIYAGASLKWTYNISYKLSEEHNYSCKSDFLCYAGVFGFSVNISKLYFDFRYEINQPNTNLDFNKIQDIPELYKNVFLEKNENILSFACGIMF